MRDRGSSYRSPAGKAPEPRKRTVDADGLDERAYAERVLRKRSDEEARVRLAAEAAGPRPPRRRPPTRGEQVAGMALMAGAYGPPIIRHLAEISPAPWGAAVALTAALLLSLGLIWRQLGIERWADLSPAEWRTALGMGLLGLVFGVVAMWALDPPADRVGDSRG